MVEAPTNAYAHVIANIDVSSGQGGIDYVLPSRKRTGSDRLAGAAPGDPQVRLVLKDAAGKEIGGVHPELRFEACDDGEKPHRALIQQDVELSEGLAQVDLEFDGKTVDTFRPEQAGPIDEQFRETASWGLPLPGDPDKLALGTGKVTTHSGVSYMVQAKPDNSDQWQTLSIGKSTPEFVVDKNQFPGASSLDVRVTQNAGFESRTVDERTIKLE